MGLFDVISGRVASYLLGRTGLPADVELIGGKNKLLTEATVIVQSTFGRDGFADSWFSLGSPDDCSGVGAAGDTIRIQIPVGCLASLVAIDYTYTVTAGDVADPDPENAVRDAIVSALNLDSNFNFQWKAKNVRDNGIIVIQSRFRGERGERTSWSVTTIGTTTIQLGFADIQQRSKEVTIAADADDPRTGLFGVSGTVSVLPGSIGARFEEFLLDGSSRDMRINGSPGSPIIFEATPDATDQLFVSQWRFFGGGNGIKFNQFLSKSGAGGLSNGLELEIKSDNEIFNFPLPIKTTEDFKNLFGSPDGASFRIDVQAGSDQFIAYFIPEVPFILQPQGTFGTGNDDYVRCTIKDNITSGLNQLESLIQGFRKEP
jgi:hypothetical protein